MTDLAIPSSAEAIASLLRQASPVHLDLADDTPYGEWQAIGRFLVTIQQSPRSQFLLPKINFNGPLARHRPDLGHCWIWTAATNRFGYGKFSTGTRVLGAHRWIYTQIHGDLPSTTPLDHFACSNRPCVRPDHLKPVSMRENTLRSDTNPFAVNAARTHCANGHEFTEENTYWWYSADRVAPHRRCQTCAKRHNKNTDERRKRERAERRRSLQETS
jgi:hypothetical protein